MHVPAWPYTEQLDLELHVNLTLFMKIDHEKQAKQKLQDFESQDKRN